MHNPKILIVGGPGAGKSSLLQALADRGFGTAADNARTIIRRRKASGLSPRPSPPEFAREILRLDIEAYARATAGSGLVFFERGIPDAVGMLNELGLLTPDETQHYLIEYPYFAAVFVLPPWQEIYRTDDERDQAFADSVRVHDAVSRWYARCGYEVITVPRMTVAYRCAFVLQSLERHQR